MIQRACGRQPAGRQERAADDRGIGSRSRPIDYRQNRLCFSAASRCARRCSRARPAEDGDRGQEDAFLGGDRRLNLGELMEVFSLLKAAGVEHVGIETSVSSER
jgi:hypothetical protein